MAQALKEKTRKCRNYNIAQHDETWQNYETASAVKEKPENVRIATLLSLKKHGKTMK